MRKPGLRGEFWPTEQEEQLLRAAFFPGAEATRAWERVTPALDIDGMPWETVRLLPLVYRNLAEARADDPDMPRLRGLYRRAWYHNNLQLATLGDILRSLDAAGIDTLVLKGAALIERYYGDAGLRPMTDVDVLVPLGSAGQAMRILEARGWDRPRFTDEQLLRGSHGIGYRGAQGRRVDLHWQLSLALSIPGRPEASSEAFWERSLSAEVGGIRTRVLDPADQLLHVLVHGFGAHHGTTVQWAADALTILRAEPHLDWDILVEESGRRRVVLPVRDSLSYLVTTLGAPVPSEVGAELSGIPTTRRDVFVHWATARHRARFLGGFLVSLAQHFRMQSHRGTLRSIAGIPAFLKEMWGLDHVWQVPAAAGRRLARKVAGRRGAQVRLPT